MTKFRFDDSWLKTLRTEESKISFEKPRQRHIQADAFNRTLTKADLKFHETQYVSYEDQLKKRHQEFFNHENIGIAKSTESAPAFKFDDSFLRNLTRTIDSTKVANDDSSINETERASYGSDESSEHNDNSDIESEANASDSSVENIRYAQPCSPKRTGARSSASDLKANAFDSTFMRNLQNLTAMCNENCGLNRECTRQINIVDLFTLRISFWGDLCDEAPHDSERATKLLEFLTKQTKKDSKGNLQFQVGSKYVCESSFLRLLGLMTGPNLSFAPSMYSRLKSGFLHGDTKKELIKKSNLKLDAEKAYSVKKGHAFAYINKIAKDYSDALPSVGTSENANVKARVIPYQGVDSFFDEYKYFCDTCDPPVDPETRAGRTVFRSVFNSLKESGFVKLLSSKHGFQTCSICNHCNSIISGGSGGRDPVIREVTQKLKRLHMQQQHNERMNADVIQMRAATEKDVTGQPQEIYIDIDGMTVRTGDTPLLGKKSRKAGLPHHIENRNIGAHLVCGPIDTYVSLNTNNLVPGGANVIIEVTKRCIEIVAEMLSARGFFCPKKLSVQYDNCGENKNKYGNGFFSLLVEEGYFDEIEVFYLVVGHTHNRLDQWFSVLSKAIYSSECIGSAIALHELYKIAHSENEVSKRPSRVEMLHSYHDWAEYLKPVLNDKIKHYQVPHRTRFTRKFGKAIMQYMLFSPEQGWDPLWLPIPPPEFEGDIETAPASIPLTKYMIFDGEDKVYKELGLNGDKLYDTLKSSKTRETLNKVTRCFDAIGRLEELAIRETIVRHAQECDTGFSPEIVDKDIKILRDIEMAMLDESSSAFGYIIWLIRGNNPTFGKFRPDVLPNPDLWKRIITEKKGLSNTATSSDVPDVMDLIDIELHDDHIDAPSASSKLLHERSNLASQSDGKKKKTSTPYSQAMTRLTAFKRGAIEMQATADMVAKFPKEIVTVHPNSSISIVDATQQFTKSMITAEEIDWYASMSTVEKIFEAQMHRVNTVMSKPWQLLELPNQSEAEKRRNDERRAESVRQYALAEARLQRFLTKRGEDNLDPHHEVIGRDGHVVQSGVEFNADDILGETSFTDMTVPTLKQHCKHRKITGYSTMKRADLIKAILHYDKTRGVSISLGTSIQPIVTNDTSIPPIVTNDTSIPPIVTNDTSIPPIVTNDTDMTASSAGINTSSNIVPTQSENEVQSSVPDESIESKSQCCVMECIETASEVCVECNRSICSFMHGPEHVRHEYMQFKHNHHKQKIAECLDDESAVMASPTANNVSDMSTVEASSSLVSMQEGDVLSVIESVAIVKEPRLCCAKDCKELANIAACSVCKRYWCDTVHGPDHDMHHDTEYKRPAWMDYRREKKSIQSMLASEESIQLVQDDQVSCNIISGEKRIIESILCHDGEDSNKRPSLESGRLKGVISQLEPLIRAKMYDDVFNLLNYPSYDVAFLAEVSLSLNVAIAAPTKRIDKKRFLNNLINVIKESN